VDWKIFAGTFVTIFLTEMGDKTQFAALAASSQSKSTMTVMLAGVLFGKFLGNILHPEIMKYFSGVLFILIGIWVLTGRP
jgi:putative Ca2+/H+ antiporter (TMEM165/GDT1 family)